MDWLAGGDRLIDLSREISALGRLAQLDASLLTQLQAIDGRLAQLVAALSATDTALGSLAGAQNFRDFITMIALDDGLMARLDTVLSTAEEDTLPRQLLTDGIAAVRQRMAELEPGHFPLLRSYASFRETSENQDPGVVLWQLTWNGDRRSRSRAAGSTQEAESGAAARLRLEAGHQWGGRHFLGITLGGKLQTSLGETALFGGYASGGLGGERSLEMEYLFAPDIETQPFALAVASVLPAIANPLDFGDIWRQMMSAQLRVLRIGREGSLWLQTRVGLASSGALGQLIECDAGMQITAELRISGRYSALVERHGDTLVMQLQSSRSRGMERGLRAGVVINASELAARMKREIRGPLARLRGELGPIEDLLTPGTLLREAIQKRVDVIAADQEAATLLGLALGGESPAATRRKLAELFRGVLDSRAAVWEAQGRDVGAVLIASLVTRYPGLDHPQLRATLEAASTALQAQLQETLAMRMAGLTDAALASLLQGLARSGALVDTRLDRLNGALEGARNALQCYTGRVEELLNRLEAAASSDLEVALTASTGTGSGTEHSARAEFHADNRTTRSVYRKLLSGSIQSVLDLKEQSPPAVNLELQSWSRFAEIRRSHMLTVSFLDLALTDATVFSATARVAADPAGVLSIMSTADWERRRRTLREERSFRFTSVYSLLAAKNARSYVHSIAIIQRDEDTDEGEITAFLSRLAAPEIGLLPPRVLSLAEERLQARRGSATARDIASTISVQLKLTREQLESLMQLGQAKNRRLLAIADASLKACTASGYLSAEARTIGLQAIRRKGRGQRDATDAELLLYYRQPRAREWVDQNLSASQRAALQVIRDLAMKVDHFARMQDGMRSIYRHQPRAGEDARKLEKKYLRWQRRMERALDDWVSIGGVPFLYISKRITRETLAFLVMVCELAGLLDEPGYPLTAQLQLPGGGREQLTA